METAMAILMTADPETMDDNDKNLLINRYYDVIP